MKMTIQEKVWFVFFGLHFTGFLVAMIVSFFQ